MKSASKENIACPLCRSADWSLIDKINPGDLDLMYQRQFGIQLADHLQGITEINFYRCEVCTLRYFHPPIVGSQDFYARLSRLEWYYLTEKSEYRIAASIIPPGVRILDIGCGDGKFSKWVSQCNYVGLDTNFGGRGTTILSESISEHALRHPAAYDFVCAFQVLEHVVDIDAFVEECLRCLRPGGLFIVSVPAADSFVAKTINSLLNLPPHHLSWWPDTALQYLALKYHLSIESLTHEPLERIHYRWYSSNWAFGLVSPFVKGRNRLINISSSFHLIMGLMRPVALLRRWFLPLTYRSIPGHSVVAVYRKGNGNGVNL